MEDEWEDGRKRLRRSFNPDGNLIVKTVNFGDETPGEEIEPSLGEQAGGEWKRPAGHDAERDVSL